MEASCATAPFLKTLTFIHFQNIVTINISSFFVKMLSKRDDQIVHENIIFIPGWLRSIWGELG